MHRSRLRPEVESFLTQCLQFLWAAIKPFFQSSAGDVDMQHLICPVKILKGCHQGVASGVAAKLELLTLAGWVFHETGFDAEEHGV